MSYFNTTNESGATLKNNVAKAKNDYSEKIKIARQIVKELQKADLTYSANVRLELRKQYNERLGIYV